jgi:hypothetical protein
VRTLVRRCLLLAALLFWQGGFLFYASVVVPLGQDVLGSHRDQGFITRRVTDFLNLSGAAALLVFAWDAAAAGDRCVWRRRVRWVCWDVQAVTLGLLLWMHVRMDALLDPETFGIRDVSAFTAWHRAYLWTSTVQWAAAMLFAGLTVAAWRDEDRRSTTDDTQNTAKEEVRSSGPSPAAGR